MKFSRIVYLLNTIIFCISINYVANILYNSGIALDNGINIEAIIGNSTYHFIILGLLIVIALFNFILFLNPDLFNKTK